MLHDCFCVEDQPDLWSSTLVYFVNFFNTWDFVLGKKIIGRHLR